MPIPPTRSTSPSTAAAGSRSSARAARRSIPAPARSTRAPTGQLVTGDGYAVDPAITFPQDTLDIVINQSGEVYAKVASQPAPQLLGQLSLVNFADDAGLSPLGNNLYRETAASGQPIAGVAGDPGFGKLSQGYLEGSNVDPVKEITELISAQRAYEMNSKVIQAADEMASTVSKGIR